MNVIKNKILHLQYKKINIWGNSVAIISISNTLMLKKVNNKPTTHTKKKKEKRGCKDEGDTNAVQDVLAKLTKKCLICL